MKAVTMYIVKHHRTIELCKPVVTNIFTLAKLDCKQLQRAVSRHPQCVAKSDSKYSF
jgi:hypothetical protein